MSMVDSVMVKAYYDWRQKDVHLGTNLQVFEAGYLAGQVASEETIRALQEKIQELSNSALGLLVIPEQLKRGC